MDEVAKDRLASNVSNCWKMASTWVMTASGAAFAVYLSLPAAQQQTLIDHLPVQPWVVPIITSTIGIVARMWPQKSVYLKEPE